MGREEFFEIDHFRPRSRLEFRHLVAAYTNLYYCCGKCNRLKGSTWPSPKQTLEGFRFSDPCAEDMYVAHLQETGSGHLEALTQCGRYTCENIRLDRPDLVAWRRAKRATAMDIAKLEKTARELEILALAAADSAEREQRLEEIRALRDRIEEARRRFCF